MALAISTLCLLAFSTQAFPIGRPRYVETVYHKGDFVLVEPGAAAPLHVDVNDYAGVVRAVADLQGDLARVTGKSPLISRQDKDLGRSVVIIGTIGKSAIVDRLVQSGKLDVTSIAGKWESFVIQTATSPFPGVSSALIIAGSDKRGTIYGIYDLSEQIGVSPWYWWADIPVAHKDALFAKPGKHLQGPPAVKYRGIFLNDEAPSLTGWVKATYGNYNHQFYEKVFELLLRLKANFLWPAMWNNAFNEDDPLNPKMADEYGIVMGTSHRCVWATSSRHMSLSASRSEACSSGTINGGFPRRWAVWYWSTQRTKRGTHTLLMESPNRSPLLREKSSTNSCRAF